MKIRIIILLDIFSEIRRCSQLLFCLMGRRCRPLLILARHLLVLRYKFPLCIKYTPFMPILLSDRHLLNVMHLFNSRYMLKIRNYLVLVYSFVLGGIIIVYLLLLIALHKMSLVLVHLCIFLSRFPFYFPNFVVYGSILTKLFCSLFIVVLVHLVLKWLFKQKICNSWKWHFLSYLDLFLLPLVFCIPVYFVKFCCDSRINDSVGEINNNNWGLRWEGFACMTLSISWRWWIIVLIILGTPIGILRKRNRSGFIIFGHELEGYNHRLLQWVCINYVKSCFFG